MIELRELALSTGLRLHVAANNRAAADALPLLFLHGFPESHRTWRHQIAAFAGRHPIAAPDLRGFGASGKPASLDAYEPKRIVADVVALADTLGWDRFVLIGHDWGGAIAWATALAHPGRLTGLAIANAPHPYLFQKYVIEDPAQRAASQYINSFRSSALRDRIASQGIEHWFNELMGDYVRAGFIDEAERAVYLSDWARIGAVDSMLNWYAASPVLIPRPGESVDLPWLAKPFSPVTVPTLVMWGLEDRVLLPVLLDGLDELVPELRVVRIAGAGHFSPWEAPREVTRALFDFIAGIR